MHGQMGANMIKHAMFAMAGLGAAIAGPVGASEGDSRINNVVLVHGAFVDGSGWRQVHDLLIADGYQVSVVQNPLTSLADDVAAVRRAVQAMEGPVILVGHSYGGAVITEAGNDDRVQALVYIAAFVPDAGESVRSIVSAAPPGAPAPPIVPTGDGALVIDRSAFAQAFAADIAQSDATFLANSQQPWAGRAFADEVATPAWKTKKSWYLAATEDRMIPLQAQLQMGTRAGAKLLEAKASHSVFLSRADTVFQVIEMAASGRR